ncbi:hypothetical protein ILUMI_06661 [Ignelater luminosus]|uniref:Uncharacterized protein n=1 Tax=Ignelater luminosus TaxID=2038154 RepID=A0A8K0D9U6_IGNLU|nr:hypothetical protein ILUMI_06661 [Ignelater luminosus]
MKSAGPVRLVFVLLAITWASALPTKETTTRRYNFLDGHNTNNTTLLGTSNTETNHTINNELARKLYQYNNTFSRFRNNSLKTNGIRKRVTPSLTKQTVNNRLVLTTTKAPKTVQPKIGAVKINHVPKKPNKPPPKGSVDDDIIIVDFFQNIFEDLNTPNKTLKVVRANKTSTLHKVKTVTTTTARPLKKVTVPIRRINTNSNRLKLKQGTTLRPASNVKKENKNWPTTTIKDNHDLNRYKNYTQLHSNTKNKKRRPVIHKVVSKWSDQPPYSNFKQSWYDHGIPVPSPNPEIFTYSPQVSINSGSADSPGDEDYDDYYEAPNETPNKTPIHQVALDINSDEDQLDQYSGNGVKCPSVHLTNSVYGPTTKQGCSDLNIAINTHVHQNTGNDRFPENDPLEGAASAENSEAVSPPRPADTPVAAAPATVSADSVPAAVPGNAAGGGGTHSGGAVSSGATNTGGGTGGLPSLPGLPEFGFPDLSQIFQIFGFLRDAWNALGNVFRLIRFISPLLWLIPLSSFALGFLSILPLFPWWLPLLFLFTGKKKKSHRPEIVIHHHPPETVHHHDGWYWNHNTQTWSNVLGHGHGERSINDDFINNLSVVVTSLIKTFGGKYSDESQKPSQPQFGDTIKQLTSQLMNISSDVTLDTRTPPKIKQQLKKAAQNKGRPENSHPGVAVPVEESDLILEESTKKFSFYKIENKPTTDGGLSTWVLLNSQTVSPLSYSTAKTSRKPVIKQKLEENKTTTDSEILNKITKPLFKKRPVSTTTKKPPTTTMPKTTTPSEKEHKLTKIKASVLTNAMNNKNKTDAKAANKKLNDNTTPFTNKLQEVSTVRPNQKVSTTVSINDNELIPEIEAKEGEMELLTTTQSSKKGRRPATANKRKKNKNKRRRPNIDRSDTNSTKVANKLKEKPISTQIYNYLSREIIPTVGVGLVGLMVTAGLASYFLYPFGIARRSYEVDRKDKEDTYYYNDEYNPGGIAEEEVIGKVIAGMPSNNYQGYRSPSSRDVYSNVRQKQNDYGFRKSSQSPSDAIYLTPSRKYGEEDNFYYRNHKPDYYNLHRNNYNQEIIEHSQETGYTVDDKQFVVGNVPKDVQEVTPAVVPEHGPRHLPGVKNKEKSEGLSEIVGEHVPRSLPEIFTKHGSAYIKSRKRRSNDMENEIDGKIDEVRENTESTPDEKTAEETNTDLSVNYNKPQSLLKSLKSYFEETVRMGLEFLDLAAKAVSKYLHEVRSRFNNQSDKMQSKEQPRMN